MEDSGNLGAFAPERSLTQKVASGDSLGLGKKASFRASWLPWLVSTLLLGKRVVIAVTVRGARCDLTGGHMIFACDWLTHGVLLWFKDGGHLLKTWPAFSSFPSWAQHLHSLREDPVSVVFQLIFKGHQFYVLYGFDVEICGLEAMPKVLSKNGPFLE